MSGMAEEHQPAMRPQAPLSAIMGPLEYSLCGLLVAIVIITFMQVLFRYVFQWSLAWTEELARYLFVWLASLGAAYAFKTRTHFVIMFAVDKIPGALRRMVVAATAVLMNGFLLLFIWQAIQYTITVSDAIGPGTGLSRAIPSASMIVGGALMVYYITREAVLEWKRTAAAGGA